MFDEEIYGTCWMSQKDLEFDISKEAEIPNSLKRIDSSHSDILEDDCENTLEKLAVKYKKKTTLESFRNFEGESFENLDIDIGESPEEELLINNMAEIHKHFSKYHVPFPKELCFRDFSENSLLQHYGNITQFFSKLMSIRKTRYGVLLSDRFILFRKREHKVSKVQIPINRIVNIYWYVTSNCSKSDCNKFKIRTTVRSYKFQCLTHEDAGLWIHRIGKLLIDRGERGLILKPPLHILKALVLIDKVKGQRIFTIEPQYTVAYYESEDDFCGDIAMHRIQLRFSGVNRESGNDVYLNLITSYRNYKLSFENIDICNQWFSTLSSIIHKAITSSTIAKNVKSGEEVMSQIYSFGNTNYCVDCGSESPEWASVNLFITLCSKCSGLHRSLGCNISKIQGILTDESTWQDENILKLFSIIGNKNVNDFFLANYQDKITRCVDRQFLYDKYVLKLFIDQKNLIFEKYYNQQALNDELLRVVRTTDVMQTMKLIHIGADINYIDKYSDRDIFTVARESGQILQLTFLKSQSKNVFRDWRNEIFCMENIFQSNEIPLHENMFFCSINDIKLGQKRFLTHYSHFQIVENEEPVTEICKIFFKNICLIRENRNKETDQIYLIIIVRETQFSSIHYDTDQIVNVIELFSCDIDQSNDVRDFKNSIAMKMCPSFQQRAYFDCIGWILLSTSTEEWRPYLFVVYTNRFVDFYNPRKNKEESSLKSFQLDLRKVHKIEEMMNSSYECQCPYKVYNLASICLISSVIYHIRSDTKYAHEECLDAYKFSWCQMDLSLSNQFLTKDNVPLAVHKMIQFLQLHASATEGPFRCVGKVREAEKIYNDLVKDPNSFILKDCMVYDVASALKLFFRKLDDPLLTKKLYKYWMAAVEIKDQKKQLQYYKNIIERLPIVNYKTLRMLIFLLIEIIINYKVTQMDAMNLSTSFYSCLLISGSQEQTFCSANLKVLPFLLDNYNYLFDVTEMELKKEEMIRKGLEQISKENLFLEFTLLRQIYIDFELECCIKSDINFELEESDDIYCKTNRMFTKQMVIEQSMTCESLKLMIFIQHKDIDKTALFEVRNIDGFRMQRLIYSQENLFAAINYSETLEPKAARRWVFKVVSKEGFESCDYNSIRTLKCWGYCSYLKKNKIFIELNETGQLNFWKSDQTEELLDNFTIMNILLYYSCDQDKHFITFKRSKSSENNLQKLFKFRTTCYNYINFLKQSDYKDFLRFFNLYKIDALIPLDSNPRLPRRI